MISPLHLAGFAACSQVNGPGRRCVVWVQGCTLGCGGCFNPMTHAPRSAGETGTPAGVLAARILAARKPQTAGLTLSGGEPFQQAESLAEVCRLVRAAWPECSVFAFSGYRLAELRAPDAPAGAALLLSQLDLLVDGRFVATECTPDAATGPNRRPWRASANPRRWILGRRPAGLEAAETPDSVEIQVADDGSVLLSGFPDPALRRAIRELAR